MSHLGQLSRKKIEINPLAAAIGVPAVREEANFHLLTLVVRWTDLLVGARPMLTLT
jgi:hypothetical protein